MNAISQALIQLADAINNPAATRSLNGSLFEERSMADAFAEFLKERRASAGRHPFDHSDSCGICEALKNDGFVFDDDEYTEEDFTPAQLNGVLGSPGEEFHTDWREDLEASGLVPRNIVAGYVNDVTEAAILNAATLARIGRKWGLDEE